jgi:eukaryotic-like serine/threonine-protein kinase
MQAMERDADPLEVTVEARLRTLGPRAATLREDPRTTIEPPGHGAADTGGQRALAALEGLRPGGGGAPSEALRLERTLGEGGMGIVRLGEQTALGRKVAVKTLRPGHTDGGARLRILREAWITGALEHPNIVPVHDVALDAQGMPVIVLKRIEGVEWSELIADGESVRDRFGAADLLEWNLQILMHVCNAVHFAHSRGIVHRDLKPENVMVGEFGEVYVLDWGIAVSLRDDGSGRFPLASQATEMAGTPCYMAPEMLGGDAPRLSARTDVYLLGAVLYEILTGAPPHEGETPVAIVRSVLGSPPSLPEDAPEELARICRRALAADPAERFDSVEALRTAIQGFLQHRGSARLAKEAWRKLRQLERGVADARGPDHAPGQEERVVRLYDLFGECRFGFRQALGSWPDNVAARKGLARAFATMARFELAHGDPKAAGRLLGEMDDPPADLVERVEHARAAEEARRGQLEALGRALDPTAGRRTRTVMAAFLGVLWTVTPLVAGLFFPDVTGSPLHFTAATVGYLVIALGLGLWARESMSKTLINRRIFATVIFFLLAQLVLIIGAEPMGLGIDALRGVTMFLWCVITGMVAVHLDPRFAAVCLGYLAAFVAVVRWPQHYYLITAAANLNLTVSW